MLVGLEVAELKESLVSASNLAVPTRQTEVSDSAQPVKSFMHYDNCRNNNKNNYISLLSSPHLEEAQEPPSPRFVNRSKQ